MKYFSFLLPKRASAFYSLAVRISTASCVLAIFAVNAFGQCNDVRDGAERTNAGLEFLLVFQDNDATNDKEPEIYQEVYVATIGEPAKVEITSLAEPGLKEIIHLGAKDSKTYRIESNREFMLRSTLADQHVVKVTSDMPIVCYGLNHKHYSADAFMAMPRKVAGTEFRVMAYRNSRRQPTFKRPSQFAVAAFEDNTTVTITPTARTINGKPAGVPFQVNLRAGEAIQIQAKPDTNELDLTGSIVRSDKPVTVYAGHSRSEIPSDSGTSSDHLAETLPPVHTWGKKFIVADYPFPGTSQSDLLRVLALDNNTKVFVNGNEWTTLGENQFRDTTYKGNLAVEATGPVLVGTFAHTTGDGISTQLGDPFFIIAPPLEQTYINYTIFNSDDPIYLQHFALIVSETSGKNRVRLDDSLVPPLAFRDLPQFSDGTQYSIARAGVGKGFHRLRTDNFMENGIVVMAYGMGFIDSYGYTAASLFRPTNALRAVKQEHSSPVLTPHKNELEIKNITDQTVFLDGAELELYGEAADKYSVRLREDMSFDIRELAPQGSVKLHFDVEPPLEEAIRGVVRVKTHTVKWTGMYDSNAEFDLYPASQAGLLAEAGDSEITLVHDPLGRSVTIAVQTDIGKVSIKLYDALGRRIMTVADEVGVTGQKNFIIQKDQLPSGYYFVEASIDHSPSVRKGFSITR
jgi:hypothetical protein